MSISPQSDLYNKLTKKSFSETCDIIGQEVGDNAMWVDYTPFKSRLTLQVWKIIRRCGWTHDEFYKQLHTRY